MKFALLFVLISLVFGASAILSPTKVSALTQQLSAQVIKPQQVTSPIESTEAESTEIESSGAKQDDDLQQTVDQILEGHSVHGESFNEGPRQKAYLMGGTGSVHFPVTTCSPEAQKFIDQGVGQLHGFWYLEAERSFRHAAFLDPDCAMAYWGAAMATEQKPQRAAGFIDQASSRIQSVTDRERLYIEALDKFLGKVERKGKRGDGKATAEEKKLKLSADEKKSRASALLYDLESIAIKYPDDIEAKAFVAHRIWYNSRAGIPISSYTATESLIREVLAVEPLHPAHHYMIHLWDHRHAENALQSAARCGIAAPAIAHMWHMPGHIYSDLHRYEDAVYQQEASARVDHAHMMRDRVMPDEISNFAHNNEWLIRNLVFLGRAKQAQALATNMTKLPMHPKYNTIKKRGSYGYGRRRLIQVLREFQMFDETVRICNETNLLSAKQPPQHYAEYLRIGGVAAVMTGNKELHVRCRNELQTLLASTSDRQSELTRQVALIEGALDKSDDRPPRPRAAARTEIESEPTLEDLEMLKKELTEIKNLPDAYEKSLLAITGHEQLVAKDFESAHESLEKAKGEDASWLAEILMLAGSTKEGFKVLEKQVDKRPKQVIPLARLAFWQHSSGRTKEAHESFERLRDCSSAIDINLSMFRRLGQLAEEAGQGEDWLKPHAPAGDIGFRPPLDSLGPAHWSPPAAPDWELVDSNGHPISSADFVDRPHIIIFFLGHGCLHCAEQIQAFSGCVKDFKDSGIDIIAISSDDPEGLTTSVANFDGELPYYALASDQSLSVFKKFRAFDDFEQQPLHGTFLIDGQGKILWQDISFQPFMDHQFLLSESQRLLFDASSQNRKSELHAEISVK